MRHEMSLRGGIFNGAVNLFDDKLQDVLFTLVRQGLCEGEVTLKVSIDLARKEIIDEDGMPHDVVSLILHTAAPHLLPRRIRSAAQWPSSLNCAR